MVDISHQVDKDVLLALFQNIQIFSDFVKYSLENTKTVYLAAMESNDKVQMASSERAKIILESIDKILQKDDISPDERQSLIDKMIEVHEKQNFVDDKHKQKTNEIADKNRFFNEKIIALVITAIGIYLKKDDFFPK